jgi:hypothetical protein
MQTRFNAPPDHVVAFTPACPVPTCPAPRLRSAATMHGALAVLAEHAAEVHRFELVAIEDVRPYDDPAPSPSWRSPGPLIPPTEEGRRGGIQRPATAAAR